MNSIKKYPNETWSEYSLLSYFSKNKCEQPNKWMLFGCSKGFIGLVQLMASNGANNWQEGLLISCQKENNLRLVSFCISKIINKYISNNCNVKDNPNFIPALTVSRVDYVKILKEVINSGMFWQDR